MNKPIFLASYVVLCSVLLRYFWGQIGDDAFIFFRYVDHLTEYHTILWNVPPSTAVTSTSLYQPSLYQYVEGYSSPLWLGVLTLASCVVDVVLAAKMLGALFLVGALWRVWQMSHHNVLAMFGASCGLGVQYWATGGLETSLHAWLFLSLLYVLQSPPTKNSHIDYLCVALFGLTRPESPAILLIVLFLWKGNWQEKLYLYLPTMGYCLYRIVVFADIFPNTYYAKATGDVLEQFLHGLHYTQWILISLGMMALVLWIDAQKKSKSPVFVPTFFVNSGDIYKVIVVLCAQTAVVVYGGGDWMWFGRLLVPLYLAMWALSARYTLGYRVLLCAPLLPLGIPFSMGMHILQGQTLPVSAYQEGSLLEVSKHVATAIRENIPTDAIIAVNHAGAIPYYLSAYTILDMSALNDPFLAKQEGNVHAKYDVEYVLSQKPTLIVLNSFQQPYQPDYWEGETELFQHPSFTKEYVPIQQSWQRIRSGGGYAYMYLFQRRKNIVP